jgi:predicted phage terminase large subunit-like protein
MFTTKEQYLEFISKTDLSLLPKEAVNEITAFLETEAIKMAQESFYHYVLLMGPTRIEGFETGRHIQKICSELQDLAERLWKKTGLTPRKMISLPPGGMKPLEENTLVTMGDGSLKALRDVRVGDYVITHKRRPRKVEAVHRQGKLDIIEITTEKGRKILSAPDHPFLTPEGWLKAEELTVEKSLAVPDTYETHWTGGFEYDSVPYFTDRIKSVVKLEQKMECLCLTVEEDHSFLAEGVVVHNSELCSRLFPSWLLGKWPKIRMIIVGHGIDFAVDEFGAKIRDIVRSDEYKAIFPRTTLREDKQTAGRFLTKDNGEMVCTSLEAKIAGRRAHIIISDDCLVEEDALSKAIRTRLVSKYMPNVRSRLLLTPDCAELMVGCLTADTQILKADGTYANIIDLKEGDEIQTLNHETFKMEVKPVIKQWKAGRDKIYELHTANGGVVKGNWKHPFLLSTNKYCRLSELKVGDEIVLRAKDFRSGVSLEDEKAWLLGFMYGDGWLIHTKKTTKNKPNNQMRHVTCVAKGEYERVNSRVIRAFKDIVGVDLRETKAGYYRSDTKRAWEFFNSLGFKGNAHTKRVPNWIFGASEGTRGKFLEGFLEADGWEVTGRPGAFCTELCNELLVKDIKRLAQSLGYSVGKIKHRTRVAQPPNSPKPFVAHSYSVSISGKQCKDEFTTTKVTKVVDTGIEEDIYDLEVADNHNFIAEGLITHNTRWCQGDLFDYLEKEDRNSGSPWDIITVPALLDDETSKYLREKDDPEGYLVPNTSFWPELHPTRRLEMIRASYVNNMPRWNSVYMQNPTPESGQIINPTDFKMWKEETPPQCHSFIVTADTAYTKSTQADFTAYQLWGLFNYQDHEIPNSIYKTHAILLNARKGKWDYPELVQLFTDMHRRDKVDFFILEERSSGLALIPDLQKRGIPVMPWKTEKDKIMRMQAAAPLVKSGIIWVPMPETDAATCAKSTEFISDICSFPGGNHDDVPDAFSQFLLFCRDENVLTDQDYIYQEAMDDKDEEEEDSMFLGGSYTSGYLRR